MPGPVVSCRLGDLYSVTFLSYVLRVVKSMSIEQVGDAHHASSSRAPCYLSSGRLAFTVPDWRHVFVSDRSRIVDSRCTDLHHQSHFDTGQRIAVSRRPARHRSTYSWLRARLR